MPAVNKKLPAEKKHSIGCPECGVVNVWPEDRSSGRCVECGCKFGVERSKDAAGGYLVYPMNESKPKKELTSNQEALLTILLFYLITVVGTFICGYFSLEFTVPLILALLTGLFSLAVITSCYSGQFDKIWDWIGKHLQPVPAILIQLGTVIFPFAAPILLVILIIRLVFGRSL